MEPALTFRLDDLTDPPVQALVAKHLAGMRADTPPEDVHALGHEALQAPEIDFFSVWAGEELVGCGALRRLDQARGELKSMRVEDAWLGKGVGRALLAHLIAHARAAGLTSLWLETGRPFSAAVRLYERAGFRECGPFGSYRESPFSLFMTLDLGPPAA